MTRRSTTTTAPSPEQLQAAAPDGIDVYFDNVGGEHLEAALATFNDGGRAALCGAISQYNTHRTAGRRRSNMVEHHHPRAHPRPASPSATTCTASRHSPPHMAGWLAAGDIVYDETVVDGIENSVDAFLALMRGANTGKMVVKMAPLS